MESVLIIALALISTVVPAWLGLRHGLIRWVSPMHLLAAFAGFGFLLKVSVYAARPELAFYRQFVSTPSAELKGALYLSLFILLMALGYRLACRPMPAHAMPGRIAQGLARRGALLALTGGVAAATIAMILQARGATGLDHATLAGLNSAKQINVNAQGVGATLAGLKTLFVIPKFAFILLLAHGLAGQDRLSLTLAGCLAALLVLIALVSGDRFELVELGLYALATYALAGGRPGLWVYGLAVLAVAGVWGLSAYMTQLRGAGEGLLTQIVGSTYFLDINAAVMVTDLMQPADHLGGQSYLWWSFGWVPRAIWLDKPAIDLGVFFKRDVIGLTTGGAFNVTGPGEAFINFRWAGLAVAPILGVIYRLGEAWLLSPRATMRFGAAYLYPILFYPFVQATLQSSFSSFVVGAAAQLLLIALMIPLFLTRYRPPPLLMRAAHA